MTWFLVTLHVATLRILCRINVILYKAHNYLCCIEYTHFSFKGFSFSDVYIRGSQRHRSEDQHRGTITVAADLDKPASDERVGQGAQVYYDG